MDISCCFFSLHVKHFNFRQELDKCVKTHIAVLLLCICMCRSEQWLNAAQFYEHCYNTCARKTPSPSKTPAVWWRHCRPGRVTWSYHVTPCWSSCIRDDDIRSTSARTCIYTYARNQQQMSPSAALAQCTLAVFGVGPRCRPLATSGPWWPPLANPNPLP